MVQFSKVNAFYSQANKGRQKVPDQDSRVASYDTGTGAQNQQNQATSQQTQRIASQDVAGGAAAVNNEEIYKPVDGRSTITSSSPIKFSTSKESIADDISAQYNKGRESAGAAAIRFSEGAAKNLQGFYNTTAEGLQEQAQRTLSQLAPMSAREVNDEKMLQLASTGDQTTNVPLLSQMYNVSPEGLALESQVRQGEINKLRGDATGALADRDVAQGASATQDELLAQEVQNKTGELDTAYQAETDRIADKEAQIRNNPAYSLERQNQEIQKLQQERDGLRDQVGRDSLVMVNRTLEAYPEMRDVKNHKPSLSLYHRAAETLRRRGFSQDEIRKVFASNGLSPEQVDLVTDPAAVVARLQQIRDEEARAREKAAAEKRLEEFYDTRRGGSNPVYKAGDILATPFNWTEKNAKPIIHEVGDVIATPFNWAERWAEHNAKEAAENAKKARKKVSNWAAEQARKAASWF